MYRLLLRGAFNSDQASPIVLTDVYYKVNAKWRLNRCFV
jgi:hypothetical protein